MTTICPELIIPSIVTHPVSARRVRPAEIPVRGGVQSEKEVHLAWAEGQAAQRSPVQGQTDPVGLLHSEDRAVAEIDQIIDHVAPVKGQPLPAVLVLLANRLLSVTCPRLVTLTADVPFQPTNSVSAVSAWPWALNAEPLSCTLRLPVRFMFEPMFSLLPDSTSTLPVTLPVVVVEAVAPLDRLEVGHAVIERGRTAAEVEVGDRVGGIDVKGLAVADQRGCRR